jgi:hypothetical protein
MEKWTKKIGQKMDKNWTRIGQKTQLFSQALRFQGSVRATSEVYSSRLSQHWRWSGPGLPDGIFSNQKFPILINFGGP